MPRQDLENLFEHYREIIHGMPETFDSHQFIIKLAQVYQTQYIEALYAYRNRKYRRKPAPFMVVHGILAKRLTSHRDLIERVLPDKDSKDIFGSKDSASRWKKRHP